MILTRNISLLMLLGAASPLAAQDLAEADTEGRDDIIVIGRA